MNVTSSRPFLAVLTAGIALMAVLACGGEPRPARHTTTATAVPLPAATPSTSHAPASPALPPALPDALVHKSPTCGCCSAWVDHLRHAGFSVRVHETDDLEPIRQRLGVPFGKGSCHTAQIGGLVVEGHVPAEDIKRLLAAPGTARGLTVPGMPAGSPGMEMPDGRVQRYTVEQINADGTTTAFATHGGP